MAELKLTKNLTGWFNVKVFNERTPRENWKLKGEDDQIAFTVTFAAGDPAAVAFMAHGKPYANANGNQRLRVNFKIGARCRWFDEQAQPIAKPLNSVLDGKQYECVIQYNELAGDPANPKAPRGYWANAIQVREVVTNPFAVMPGAAPVPPMPQQQHHPQQQPQYQQQQQQQYQQHHPQQQPQYQQQQQQQYQQLQPQQQQQPQYQQQQPTWNIGFPPPPTEDIIAPRGMSAPMPPMYNDNDNLPY